MIAPTGVVDIKSPKFAGHETFTLRYGWLKKAVDAVLADPMIFTREDALVTLGVGKNMVRSIRHWGLATKVLEEDPEQENNRGRHIRSTQLGNLLFGPGGIDPYMEEPGTLWLLHWNLASTPDGPTSWYWTFYRFAESEFTKERLIAALLDLAGQAGWSRVAESSLKRDVDCFIRTYVPSPVTKAAVAEDTLDCPLAELGLIQDVEAGRVYATFRDERASLPLPVFVYALLDAWATGATTRQTLSFEDIAYRPGSPGRVFRLSEDALVGYLERLDEFTNNALGYDVTAGLRQVYRRREVEPLDMLKPQKPHRIRAGR